MQSFVTVYMKNCGISEYQIGSISAWAIFSSLGITFLIGNFADRLQLARGMVVFLILMHSISSFLYMFARGYFHFLGLDILRSVAYSTTTSMVPLLVLSILPKNNRGKHYSNYRVWGSIGFFSFALVGGVLAEKFGILFLFSIAGFCFLIAAAAFCIVKTDINTPRLESGGVSKIFSVPHLVIFYLALVPASIWGPVCFRFLPLYMNELGGSYTLIGFLMGSMGLLGIIGLPIIGRLSDRFGIIPILAINFLLVPIRLITYPLIENPYWLFVPNITHAIIFPCNEICVLFYIQKHCAPEMRNTAMVLSVVFRSFGAIIGAYFGGYLVQSMGYPAMFYITGAVSMLGLLIFIFGLKKFQISVEGNRI